MPAASPFERVRAAPVLGVGLGVDLFSDRPDFRRLVSRHRQGFDFLEIYTRGNWRDAADLLRQVPPGVPRTYHHEGLDPVGPALCPDEPVLGCVENQRLLNPPWTVEELAVRHIDGLYTDFFFPAILTQDSLNASIANLRALNARLPCPLLPENAPYEFVVGDMHLCQWLTRLAHGADCGLVLDLGHLWSYQLCAGRGDDPLHGIDQLDLSRVIEVHLAGARVETYPGGRIYRDLHGAGPIPEPSLMLLRELAPKLPNLKAVTIEVEDATERRALDQCAQARHILRQARPDWGPRP
jgi:uncharacterized protein (UPF0276 family)